MISVCIPVRNGGAEFRHHLSRWVEQQRGEELELLVLDSGSEDGTAEVARSAGARLLTIPAEEFNHGLSRNRLAEEARGDLLVFTVADACPAGDDTLRQLVEPLRQDSGLAAVTGKQIPGPGADPVARWELHYHNSIVEQAPLLKRLPPSPAPAGDFLHRLRSFAFDNVCSALRRSVWQEHRFARIEFGEDLDWGTRVLRAGHTFLRNPSACVYHANNGEPCQRLKRSFLARRATSRILGLAPRVPSLSKQEVVAGIEVYVAAVVALHDRVEVMPEPITQLHLPTGLFHPARRILQKVPYAGAQSLAVRFRHNFVADRLCGDFNAVARALFRFHRQLPRSRSRSAVLQLGAQVLGTFLGDCAYATEQAGSLPDYLEELAANLTKGPLGCNTIPR